MTYLNRFCNGNCGERLLAGGNLTLAASGRWPIYFMKWGQILLHVALLRRCVGGGRRGTEGETETKGREGVREGQTGGR